MLHSGVGQSRHAQALWIFLSDAEPATLSLASCINMALDVLQRGYEGNWLGGTFSKAVFVGNGLVAIVAGLLGHALVEVLQLGPVSPFDAAALVLLIGGAYIAYSWTENYGESSDKTPFHVSLVNAGKTIWEGARPVFSPLCFDGFSYFLTVHPV